MAQPIDVNSQYLPVIIRPVQEREQQRSTQDRLEQDRFESERQKAFEQERVETQESDSREETIASPFYRDYRFNTANTSTAGGFSDQQQGAQSFKARPADFVQYVAETYENNSLAPYRPENPGANLDALG